MSGFWTIVVATVFIGLACTIAVVMALVVDRPVGEVFGWILAAIGLATLITWAVCREREDHRLTREYRAGLRADLIDTLGIRDEVS